MHTGRARYNVSNGGIEFSLSQRGVEPSNYNHPADPHYDRIDNTYDVIPHYEQETFITNEVESTMSYNRLLCTVLLIPLLVFSSKLLFGS